MLIAAATFAALAGLVHVYIFVLESLRWEDPATRRAFGTTPETASVTRSLAYNQGFYNLFLAVVTFAGVVVLGSQRAAGIALLCAGPGSMVAAAAVLLTSNRAMLRGAAIQGLLPALSLLCLLVWGLA